MTKYSKLESRYKEMYVDVALWLVSFRDMIIHRRITVQDLAREIGCSTATIYNVLAGSHNDPESWFDELDKAVTRITDARGGILVSCGCGREGLERTREEIERATLHAY